MAAARTLSEGFLWVIPTTGPVSGMLNKSASLHDAVTGAPADDEPLAPRPG